jgi:SAM-dependent methyltransferase
VTEVAKHCQTMSDEPVPLPEILPDNFDRYAEYYRLFNQGKDYRAEVEYLEGIMSRYIDRAASILELGVGTGEHAKIFREKGYRVFGVERSPKMAALAVENGVECIIGDISRVELSEQFEVVLSLFHVISYLTLEQDLINTFKLTNNHLHQGGLFIFDVWNTDAVEFQKPETREKKVTCEGLEVRRAAVPITHHERNIVEVEYQFSVVNAEGRMLEQWNEWHPMKHFNMDEICTLASATGFEVIGSEEYLTGSAPSVNTWGVCYILRKIDIGEL